MRAKPRSIKSLAWMFQDNLHDQLWLTLTAQLLTMPCDYSISLMLGVRHSIPVFHVLLKALPRWSVPGDAAASSSARLSRKVSLLRVTRNAGPKNSAPRTRANASSGSASRVAAVRLTRTAWRGRAPAHSVCV